MTELNENIEGVVEVEPAEGPLPARRGLIRRLYDWTIHWAATPQAVWALFLFALGGASFFPLPPDVLLMAMALSTPRKALRYAAVCTVGSVLGAMLAYGVGVFFFETLGRPMIEFYGYMEHFERLSAGFGQHGFLFIFVASITPVPFRVFALTAGVCHADVPFSVLVVAAAFGRGLRFFTIGALFKFFGPAIQRFIDRYLNMLGILFVVLLVLGFACVRIFGGRGEPEEEPPQPPVESSLLTPEGPHAFARRAPHAAADSSPDRGGGRQRRAPPEGPRR